MGPFNSSATRVRPLFSALRARDPQGMTWLPKLLALAPNSDIFSGTNLRENPGPIIDIQLDPEKKLLPPEAFLSWLLENPEEMVWPKNKSYSAATQRRREALMGSGPYATDQSSNREREEAQREGLSQLRLLGAKGSNKKWWAFEGQTCVDCFIETGSLRLYIEGKRNEKLSASTDWFPARNQLMRNLESASRDSGETLFACLVIAESTSLRLPDPRRSWPHLREDQRSSLMRHFLGVVTWREVCAATAVDYDSLPHEV